MILGLNRRVVGTRTHGGVGGKACEGLPIPISTSACIDKGISTQGITAIDIRGENRPAIKGGQVDIGAYEMR